MPGDLASLRELVEQWQTLHLVMHRSEDEARQLAVAEVNRRLEEMNALRRQLTEERGVYVQRDWFDRIHDALRKETIERASAADKSRELLRDELYKKVDEIQKALKAIETVQANYQSRIVATETDLASHDTRVRTVENTVSNFEGRIWMLGGVISVAVVGLNLLLHYWK